MEKFKSFAAIRVAVGILIAISVLWIVGTVLGLFDKTSKQNVISKNKMTHDVHSGKEKHTDVHSEKPVSHIEKKTQFTDKHAQHQKSERNKTAKHLAHDKIPIDKHFAPEMRHTGFNSGYSIKGVAFVTAAMHPLAYELDERFWGWRPNDILNFTDNVNNMQLGVLEVARRTAVALAERISRTGSSASFDINLERAMNWFMVKADRYWFPSPESKYHAGIKELEKYLEKLRKGEASFHTRADNLLPLLRAYEDLLGSCDENLVKSEEEDGTKVSFFKADDYFYYAKGVASALYTILGAVEKDFHQILSTRNGLDALHHARKMCRLASELEPWIIINSELTGILANHRANMAAPINHARFYLGVLIKTLST